MNGKIDFLAFYEDIGVPPDCKPETLKTAYRHRVAALHPDRRRGVDDRAATDALQELNAAYAAAMRFQRQYGRLPGSAPHPTPKTNSYASFRQAASAASNAQAAAKSPRRRGRKRIAFAVVAVGVIVWFVATHSSDDDNASSRSVAAVNVAPSNQALANAHDDLRSAQLAAARAADERAHTPPVLIEIGMDEDSVRVIEGSPVMINGQRWDYGPSWIEFANGHVINWYSSPLRRLRVATNRP